MLRDRVRVLVVDDQLEFREAASIVVSLIDQFELVGTAADGQSALELAEQERADLILLDIHLPGMNGLAAARRLVAQRHSPAVFLMSTYDSNDLPTEIAESNLPYISKEDLDSDDLLAMWQRLRPDHAR